MDERYGSANSIADLKMSYSINGADLHIHLEGLDYETASGLKKITNGHFKRRVLVQGRSCRERKKRFLTGRQVAWMIYEYFKVSGKGRMRPGPQFDFEGQNEERQRTGRSIREGMKR